MTLEDWWHNHMATATRAEKVALIHAREILIAYDKQRKGKWKKRKE